MVKNSIPKEFIVGIVAPNLKFKELLIVKMEKANLLHIVDGKKFYKEKSIDEFIIITDSIDNSTVELLNKK